jgi:hypothetical protein
MSTDEQSPIRSSAQIPSFHEVAPKKNGEPEMMRDRGPLLSLARKLHENETALTLMRNAFRMFQRLGITVSPNHYYWPVPDFRELESRKWRAEEEPVGLDLAVSRQLDFLQTVVPQYQAEWESPSSPFFSVSYNYSNGFF